MCILLFILHFSLLELEADVEEGVERIGVVELGVLGEDVGMGIAGRAVLVVEVVAALLVTARAHIGIVEQVIDREVKTDATSLLQTDVVADVGIDHKAALALVLADGIGLEDAAIGIIKDTTVFEEGSLINAIGGVAVLVNASVGDVALLVGQIDVRQTVVGREADIDTVVVVDVRAEIPAVDVVIDAKAEGGERRATYATAVGDDSQLFWKYSNYTYVERELFGENPVDAIMFDLRRADDAGEYLQSALCIVHRQCCLALQS